jgi:hypothetical protein
MAIEPNDLLSIPKATTHGPQSKPMIFANQIRIEPTQGNVARTRGALEASLDRPGKLSGSLWRRKARVASVPRSICVRSHFFELYTFPLRATRETDPGQDVEPFKHPLP